ncbi:uncharacterized protein BX663DRAFT_516379 [Cokeromyces recurvatus]|uniref:uncharacterized protein n=1 Tax=Cokeromyces recurvatus TaxID=90255 RepID=UPI00221F1FCC|nr:uncharacterized protein BX663DRAFT_516379 [Cokeromyces recurvatus]KAI7900746.1 hypothetical protein BX663DRAFT_516379 [Cokeromyces recurvatus]
MLQILSKMSSSNTFDLLNKPFLYAFNTNLKHDIETSIISRCAFKSAGSNGKASLCSSTIWVQ